MSENCLLTLIFSHSNPLCLLKHVLVDKNGGRGIWSSRDMGVVVWCVSLVGFDYKSSRVGRSVGHSQPITGPLSGPLSRPLHVNGLNILKML